MTSASDDIAKRRAADAKRKKEQRLRDKMRIVERDGWICRLCGRPIDPNDLENMEIDHRLPRSRGGTDDEANLQASHRDCNRLKSASIQVSLHLQIGACILALETVIKAIDHGTAIGLRMARAIAVETAASLSRPDFERTPDVTRVTPNVTPASENVTQSVGRVTPASGPSAPRAPAPARPSESRISSESQAFYQDPVVVPESSQDRNGARACGRPNVRSVPTGPKMSGERPDASGQDRTGPLESDTFATTSFEKTIPEGDRDPDRIPSLPSITRAMPPAFDATRVEAEKARQRRALEEFEATDRKGAR